MLFALRLLALACVLGTALPTAKGHDGQVVLAGTPGMSSPEVRKEVKPKYTRKAEAAGIEGVVVLEAVVLTDGKVGAVQVIQSLDVKYGLDVGDR